MKKFVAFSIFNFLLTLIFFDVLNAKRISSQASPSPETTSNAIVGPFNPSVKH